MCRCIVTSLDSSSVVKEQKKEKEKESHEPSVSVSVSTWLVVGACPPLRLPRGPCCHCMVEAAGCKTCDPSSKPMTQMFPCRRSRAQRQFLYGRPAVLQTLLSSLSSLLISSRRSSFDSFLSMDDSTSSSSSAPHLQHPALMQESRPRPPGMSPWFVPTPLEAAVAPPLEELLQASPLAQPPEGPLSQDRMTKCLHVRGVFLHEHLFCVWAAVRVIVRWEPAGQSYRDTALLACNHPPQVSDQQREDRKGRNRLCPPWKLQRHFSTLGLSVKVCHPFPCQHLLHQFNQLGNLSLISTAFCCPGM
ncbi:hypothetical protein INR49_010238 [Caranx melampygus]|nr:hypothetical protein INR49_010238 [Caranx melampygus]